MGNKNIVTAHTGASHISTCILRGQIRRCHSPAYRHGEKAWENVRSVIVKLVLRPSEGWEACTFSVNLPSWGGTSLRHSCHWRRAKVKGYRENKVWVTLFIFPDEAKTSHTPLDFSFKANKFCCCIKQADGQTDTQKGILSAANQHLGLECRFGTLPSLLRILPFHQTSASEAHPPTCKLTCK